MTDATDTIRIGKTAIRLDGIDAPEGKQTCFAADDGTEWPCGKQASRALEQRIDGTRRSSATGCASA